MKRALSIVVAIIVLMLLVRAFQPARQPPAVDDAVLRQTDRSRVLPATPGPESPSSSGGLTQVQVDAMTAAVDVVHRYLQTVAQGKWDEADALWVRGRAPSTADEGALRTLLPARVLRIRNASPELKDKDTTPGHIEVPVRVTLTGKDDKPYAFTGHYLVERATDDAGWRLARAELHAELDRP